MPEDFSDYLAGVHARLGVPPLTPGQTAFRVVFVPTFHLSCALTVADFGDYADVTLHAEAWRESKTVIGEKLTRFREAMAAIAVDRMSHLYEAERDGIILELSAQLDDRSFRVEATSPGRDSAPDLFARALLELGRAVLGFAESRALLDPLERYRRV